MKRALFLVFTFLLTWLVAMVVTAPAPWLHGRIADRLPVTLTGIEGTLWHGRARSVQWNGRPLARLEWRWRPWRLLLADLELGITLHSGAHLLEGAAGIGAGGAYLRELAGTLPAPLLGRLLKIEAPLEGEVVVDLEYLADGEEGPEIEGTLAWREAALGGKKPIPLGEILLEPDLEEGRIGLKIRDRGEGPLRLEGEITFDARGFHLDLLATPRESADRQLVTALKLAGRRERNGGYRISNDGRM